jgi:hypothetical protein
MSQNDKTSGALTNRINQRHIFASWTRQRQAAQLGLQTPTRIQTGSGSTNQWTVFQSVVEGAAYTTSAEQASYIAEVSPPVLTTVPTAPLNVVATAGNGEASIAFDIPISNGGAAITSYTVTSNPEGLIVTGPTSPITFTGLANGETYTFSVTATNSVGTGPASSSSTAITLTGGTLTTETFSSLGATTWLSPIKRTVVEYLIVAGGGGSGGGYDTGGGAGGGGGMVLNGTITVDSETNYSVQVGDGGAGGVSIRNPASETPGSPGEDSQFATIIALGGRGGNPSRQPSGAVNGNGGSAAINPLTAATGGNGGGSNGGGGGGGGSGGNGFNRSLSTGGNGGIGTIGTITSATYGAGGRGANGGTLNVATPGMDNTGNGARGGGTGSSAQTNGAKGGSGIVVIRYYNQT